jgi:RNA polymerase sigma-70 factor, ECF subfamily
MTSPDPRRVLAATWRIESPRLIATLARSLKSVALAEEVAQDTFVEALQSWETRGVPDKPGAWLMTAARHRALDVLRRARRVERSGELLRRESDLEVPPDFEEAPDDVVGDDLLRLMFVACHPVLSQESRVALTLRLLGGLTTDEIARAFLTPEPTIAQRITRAKRTLAERAIPFELPAPADVSARLEAVLEVIYLVFNEGYSATTGEDWMRPALCEDARRLARVLAELLPQEAEVQALLALLELQASRARARTGPNGEAVLLRDQDRAHWDVLLIRRGLEALARAATLSTRPGVYRLQAEVAACHARAPSLEATDWPRVAALYAALGHLSPSPIVELNRAVAAAMAFGADVGLALVEPLREDPSLASYPFLPSVRAELLSKLGRFEEARLEIERAASLSHNARQRAMFLERAAAYGAANAERATARDTDLQ